MTFDIRYSQYGAGYVNIGEAATLEAAKALAEAAAANPGEIVAGAECACPRALLPALNDISVCESCDGRVSDPTVATLTAGGWV